MQHLKHRVSTVLAAAALLTLALPLGARAATMESGGASPAHSETVIVQVKDRAHMASVRARLERSGAIITRSTRWNAYLVSIQVGTDQARFSAAARDIAGVSIAQGDGVLHALATTTTNDPSFPSQWGLPDIGAPEAWSVSQGAGVPVAVIDTGIDSTQPDLAGQVVLYRNYLNPSAPASDDEGHGTHVAGIIAAIGNNRVEGSGTAPQSTVYAFKVLDASGSGDDFDVAAAIRDAVDLTPCRIISMSLGASGPEDPILASAVAYAESKGALLVAAAGNDGVTTASYPAALRGVIGVGAVDSSNRLASFSNYGATDVQITAPGVNILSTVPGTTMQSWSGTSIATPFVSGAAALVWSAHPELTAAQVAEVLEGSAQDLGAPGVDPIYGHGLVRPDLALASLATPTPTPVPTPTPTPTPTPEPTPEPTPTPPPTTTPAPLATTTLTISGGTGSMRRYGTRTIAGMLTPGVAHDSIRVYVMRPGSTRWSLLALRHTGSPRGGGASWSYAFKPTRRGVYRLRARFSGTSRRNASASRTLSVRVR